MSRRMLDSSIWSNEKFAALPARGRLLLIGMIDIADDQGRLKAHPVYLAKEIFPYDRIESIEIDKWLTQMQENGTIRLYTVDGKQYAQFLNWWQYQSMQFAKPSSYPRPEGWLDCIRCNGKGNQMMVSNWVTPKGERMVDTCDQDGKPFPFVMELPAKKSGVETPAQAATQVPAEARAEVRTQAPIQAPIQAPTQARAEVPAEVRTQVNKDQDKDHDQQKKNNNNNSALHTLTRREAEKAVVVVGIDSLIAALDDDQMMALLSWLWLYNAWFEQDLSYRDIFRRAYTSDPFAGMKQPGAVMVKLARAKSPAPLQPDDRAEMMDRLRQLQEVAP